jgi:hypothetical protein
MTTSRPPDPASGATPSPKPVDPLTALGTLTWVFLILGILCLVAYLVLSIVFQDLSIGKVMLWTAVALNTVAVVVNLIRTAIRTDRQRIEELERQLAELRLRLPAPPSIE